MPPKTKLWPLGSHTPAKHMVLRRYLEAWLPIMGIYGERILFIDGFAGPGQYEGGEDGSPVIAVKSFLEHSSKGKIKAEVRFFFIEEDIERATHLEELMAQYRPQLPPGCSIDVHAGRFSELDDVLKSLEEQKKNMAPAFVMVDPFGVKGTPMALLKRILHNKKCELYISFMYEAINRHLGHPAFEGPLDALYGSPDWRQALELEGDARKEFLYDLYDRQLRDAGAQHVTKFELYEGNRLVYAIFFATKHHRGCGKMKEAIWKIAPFGDFAFRGHRHGQASLLLESVDIKPLAEELHTAAAGRGWVTVDALEEWIQGDSTIYYEKHLRPALKALEQTGRIEVDPTTRKRALCYPKGAKIRFI